MPRAHPNLVPRPRLGELLNEGMERKLTVISAPAGFGKTTLLSEWRMMHLGSEYPLAWVSLEEADDDPARFLSYLIGALQAIEANVGEAILASLCSPQPPQVESVLTALINEIASTPKDFALVLDDYHVISKEAAHEAMSFLVDHLPPNAHLVIASRADPPLPLARLRARGQMIEIRADDLRFTPEETDAFLRGAMGLDLPEESVAALEKRTEGWIAGLQLAALSVRGREDISGFVASLKGSSRYVLDYLAEEVLRCQPEDVRAFLLQTSILDRLSGPLCGAAADRGDAGEAGASEPFYYSAGRGKALVPLPSPLFRVPARPPAPDPARSGARTALQGVLMVGYVRTFVDEGEPMATLLAKLLRARLTKRPPSSQDVSAEDVGKLLTAFRRSFGSRALSTEADPLRSAHPLPDLLSGRELDVLRLIATGKSNREIAGQLFVTVDTVKKHLTHIFRKLGVRSRSQAVAQARDMGLIP